MHAAQSAPVLAQRVVDLHEAGIDAGFRELAFAKHAREKTALVLALVELDDSRTGKRGRNETNKSPRPSFAAAPPSPGRGDDARCAAARTARHRNRGPRNRAHGTVPTAPPVRRRARIAA